jgi:hypothetical protein
LNTTIPDSLRELLELLSKHDGKDHPRGKFSYSGFLFPDEREFKEVKFEEATFSGDNVDITIRSFFKIDFSFPMSFLVPINSKIKKTEALGEIKIEVEDRTLQVLTFIFPKA